jgi:hypothetical protein
VENRITTASEIETLQTETTITLDQLVQQGAKRMRSNQHSRLSKLALERQRGLAHGRLDWRWLSS